MYQSWGKLLFMHWRVPAGDLRRLIPERLTIDTYEDSAWIAITPFVLWNVRPVLVPPIPGVSEFNEVNCRTYVTLDNKPGVWFFSLDADSRLASSAARLFYRLPYHFAEIHISESDNRIDYDMQRGDFGLRARWTVRDDMPPSSPGSLEFFLTERYCLYAERDRQLYRARIFHQPWPLQKATIDSYESSMIEVLGLKSRRDEPALNYVEAIDVEIWAIKRL